MSTCRFLHILEILLPCFWAALLGKALQELQQQDILEIGSNLYIRSYNMKSILLAYNLSYKIVPYSYLIDDDHVVRPNIFFSYILRIQKMQRPQLPDFLEISEPLLVFLVALCTRLLGLGEENMLEIGLVLLISLTIKIAVVILRLQQS